VENKRGGTANEQQSRPGEVGAGRRRVSNWCGIRYRPANRVIGASKADSVKGGNRLFSGRGRDFWLMSTTSNGAARRRIGVVGAGQGMDQHMQCSEHTGKGEGGDERLL
jgi:hypothetical protein